MIQNGSTAWVILAGGEGRRMGYRNKGLLTANKQPLISYVANALKRHTGEYFINCNENIDAYSQFGTTFCDKSTERQGPLTGVAAAFRELPHDWIGFVPCDAPSIPNALFSAMEAARVDEHTAISLSVDGRMQPVFCLLPRAIGEQAQCWLDEGNLRFGQFIQHHPHHLLSFPAACLVNLNTPQDIKAFERRD